MSPESVVVIMRKRKEDQNNANEVSALSSCSAFALKKLNGDIISA